MVKYLVSLIIFFTSSQGGLASTCAEKIGGHLATSTAFLNNKSVARALSKIRKGKTTNFLPRDQNSQEIYFNQRLISKRAQLLSKAYRVSLSMVLNSNNIKRSEIDSKKDHLQMEIEQLTDTHKTTRMIFYSELKKVFPGQISKEDQDQLNGLDKEAKQLAARIAMAQYSLDSFLENLPSDLDRRLVSYKSPYDNELIVDYIVRVFPNNLSSQSTDQSELNNFIARLKSFDSDAYLMIVGELELYYPEALTYLASTVRPNTTYLK